MYMLKRRLYLWLSAWLDIACASISILTLTLYRPWWDITFRVYWTKKSAKARIAKRRGKTDE